MATKLIFEVEYRLKHNQPSIQQIDFEDLNELLHKTVESYLEELLDSFDPDDEE